MSDLKKHKLRIKAAVVGSLMASVLGAATRSARASAHLPVAFGSASRWQVKSSDCAHDFGLQGSQCGIGVAFSEVAQTSTSTSSFPTGGPGGSTPAPTSSSSSSSSPIMTSFPPTSGTSPSPTTSTNDSYRQVRGSKAIAKRQSRETQDLSFQKSLGLALNESLFVAPGGEVRYTGNIVEVGPQLIDDLNVSIQYRFDIASRSVRAIYVFNNPSSKTVTADARINIGGFGGDPTIQIASNGSAALQSSTRWFETVGSDQQIPERDSVLFVAYGKQWAQFQNETMIRTQSENGLHIDYVMSYPLTVPAHQTVGIMVFAQVNNAAVDQGTVDSTYDSLATLSAANLLEDLPIPAAYITNWSNAEKIAIALSSRRDQN
jgi:hypothetical protein